MTCAARGAVRFFDLLPPAGDPADEIRAGLAAPAPFISPKFFYDALGARLFAAICELPEYTLTRDEQSIFDAHGEEIAQLIGPGCTLIDLGAGDCAKAERLFARLAPSQYVAVDIARDFLREALDALATRHPALDIVGVACDFMRALDLPAAVRGQRRVAFYPGSSIGNFAPDDAVAFLERVRQLTPGGQLLIGADLVKDTRELDAAYDDALGVTAAFNSNVLLVANRLAGTDFALADWRHVAFYNAAASRIEMHLEALRAVTVRWPGGGRDFAAGSRIHTENSYKTTLPALTALLQAAGYPSVRCLTEARGRFALALAR